MRQKYLISKEAKDLIIREYAVTGKDARQTQGTMPFEDEYTFLCQETYKGEVIQMLIANDMDGLIAALRTDNLFPIGRVAEKLAESVVALYRSSDDRSTELSFDDAELFVHI